MEDKQEKPNDRLQTFRKAKKINGEAFGRILGITKSGLSNIENGRANVSIEHLDILINTFPDLNIYWLISGKGEMLQDPDKLLSAKAYWEMLIKAREEHKALSERHQLLTEVHSTYLLAGPKKDTSKEEE